MNDSNFECFLLSLKIFVEETQERFNITEDEAVEVIERQLKLRKHFDKKGEV